MRKTFLNIALAVLTLTGCEYEESALNTEPAVSEIEFGTYLKKSTKATSMTNFLFCRFLVYGYQNPTTIDWSSLPSQLMNSVVYRSPGNVNDPWTTIPAPWPAEGTHVRFYGYAPDSSIYVNYSAAISTGPTITFTNTLMEDLLVGKSSDITALAPANNERVAMEYGHALTKISFSAKVYNGLTVSISDITVQGLSSVASYNYNNQLWGNYSIPKDYACAIGSAGTNGVSATVNTNITATDGAILTIPQFKAAWEVPGTFDPATRSRLKITYSLKRNFNNTFIVGTSSSAAGHITTYLPIDLILDQNVAYTIALLFGDSTSGAGGGGYDNTGNPIINSASLIKFSTTFSEWRDIGTAISM